jgi:8-oxo-dGTP diphosphatase
LLASFDRLVIFAPCKKPQPVTSKKELHHLYGNRLRIRVCGLCISEERILMVRHRSVGLENVFWSPPGGGMAFGESAPDALLREFSEEAGLTVEPGDLLFVTEYIHPPLHALELFFSIRHFSGALKTGSDPEFSDRNQIIQEVRFMSMEEIKSFPEHHVHHLFKNRISLAEVLAIRGYLG